MRSWTERAGRACSPGSPPGELVVLAAALAGWLLLAGCGGSQKLPDYAGGSPLPYSVGVYLDGEVSELPEAEGAEADEDVGEEPPATVSAPRFTAGGDEVVESFVRAIGGRGPLVHRAVALRAGTLADALAEARDLDLVIGLRFRAPPAYDRYRRSPWRAALEITTWLFGGVPSWFVPTVQYETGTELSAQAFDINEPQVREWLDREGPAGALPGPRLEVTALSEHAGVSLYDRAVLWDDAPDYARTVVMPPMVVVPEDPEGVSAALTRHVLAELAATAERRIAAGLVAHELAQPLRIEFLEPALPRGEDAILRFDVISEGGVPLAMLDVHRLAAGRDDVPHYRWNSDPVTLSKVHQALSAGGQRVSITLPEPLPLVRGTNIIKVRALREDGRRVSRTVVVVHAGEEME